ncbi:hydantoinase B/oxoprolinase family protein [Alteraurantiacibacter aquimixticola]|uniref:5-oxoprolinase n=1 Tax=Alteraurantiacibacter aquimixticola TaxID=2489173 RepID=A0A4T3F3W1_9SPHN|nr:hydantoinase B/oxoprolinase family protein [Alteraurantiacibacter aquimixticola]TIX51139.1 5-oxoprolinase [Alteraurantiacibacter aquimixticola]
MTAGKWHFWIDRGGTFTDVVAVRPDGQVETAKLLSENPAHYDDAAVAAIRQLTGIAEGPLPEADIRIGTTVATNALLERKGEPVLLAITCGFGDALAIGTQERPDIFARKIEKPEPLPAEVLEVDERVRADATMERPLDREAARAGMQAAFDKGLRAVAIVLMHGWKYTSHEAELADIARDIGFTEIAVSHRVSPLARLIGRADTTAVDAYLSPVLARYVAQLMAALGEGHEPLFMQSSGGLVAAEHLRGKDAILSGPAGGIVGMAETAKRAGFERAIGFDMGGTSTDVSLFAGSYERDSDNRVAGVRVRSPMMRIHTVAAGGGSVCSFDGARFLVGPESAGAQPGPACYRQGGPLTVTDCNLILRKLQPDHFPAVFGPDGDQPLDREASLARMSEVLDAVEAGTGERMSAEAAAEGFIAIAVTNMANAIRAVSTAKGHDMARFALNCFGGAGGQHACLVADALGIGTVLVHPLSGVLSAYGMGLADRSETREATVQLPLAAAQMDAIEAMRDRLCAEAVRALAEQGVDAGSIATHATAQVRPEGGEATLPVPMGEAEDMLAAFAEAHRQRFGYDIDAPLVVEALRIDAVASTQHGGSLRYADAGQGHVASGGRERPVLPRAALAPGEILHGPALVVDPVATLVVEPGWQVSAQTDDMLVLTRAQAQAVEEVSTAADPVRLEIFGGLFMAIAEEMGAALQHTARSVNIRERLDFSCAIFDAEGNLIANAPHMPVHLGSMGDSVRAVVARHGGAMREGDAYALNAPYQGGTHLPDITVVRPVFVEGRDTPAFYTAARGHHADVGGIAPGSMPSASTSIEEEGVVLDAVPLVREGRFLADDMRAILSSGPYPARNIEQNLADLAAQVAACQRGATRLLELSETYGEEVVAAYMRHLLDYAEGAARKVLQGLADGSHTVHFDDGARIAVSLQVDRVKGKAVLDFAGTSDQRPSNFNAPSSVVRAAVLYCIRCLTSLPVPLNDGFLRPVTIRIPAGSMLAPEYPAAVVAGNVETSQMVTDALMGAMGAMAASQGTMNNFTFGDATHQYYETVAGGAGAGPGFAGADAVQTHMTNSRLTDPEILEMRFPVLLEEFAIRRGSGGAGEWKGGDGTLRRLRFLAPMHANILSGRRKVAPFGLAGGSDGACGANRVIRCEGSEEDLPATASVKLEEGDVFELRTPGGGGYGKA